MRISSYILSAKEILQQYNGSLPFAAWLKNYFREHKKFGSRDRKIIAQLCYSFFRLGNAFESRPIEERIQLGVFFTSTSSNKHLEELNPEWNKNAALSGKQKFAFLDAVEEAEKIFPLSPHLSAAIEQDGFTFSHLLQPNLHLRLRPGKESLVKEKLSRSGISFTELSQTALALEIATKVEEVINVNKEAVIQDYSSQQVLNELPSVFWKDQQFTCWDCCAASGGKSILLHDLFPNVQLTVSDIRTSILRNLYLRFEEAGIKGYQSFVADVSAPQFSASKTYDLVICDAPCSGSGTWGRTPEQLRFFNEEKIGYYSNLQKWIGKNASKAVKKGGAFLYITCSVFRKENEEVVAHLLETTNLQLKCSNYYKGYGLKADTLFAALFVL